MVHKLSVSLIEKWFISVAQHQILHLVIYVLHHMIMVAQANTLIENILMHE